MNEKIKKFDFAYEQFLKGEDAVICYQSIKILLSEIQLDDWFEEMIEEKDSVKNFFLMWEHASLDKEDPNEKEGLSKLGIESKKFFNEKNYKKLAELYFDITLRHLANFIHLEDRKDYKKITDHDLYKKGLIPPEIYLQFFLIESMVKREDFDWDRTEEISYQNLACLAVCFLDINAFFNEDD